MNYSSDIARRKRPLGLGFIARAESANGCPNAEAALISAAKQPASALRNPHQRAGLLIAFGGARNSGTQGALG
jgi:hypothetical protein